MTPHQSDDASALTRRERRRLRAPAPSFGEVAGGGRGSGRTADAGDGSSPAEPAGTDAIPADADRTASGVPAASETTSVATAVEDAADDATAGSPIPETAADDSADAGSAGAAVALAPALAAPVTIGTASPVVRTETPTGGLAETEVSDDDGVVAPEPLEVLRTEAAPAEWADEDSPATALLWVDPGSVAETASPNDDSDAATTVDILADAATRGPRAGWLVPLGTLVALGIAYSATALLWPLHELPASVDGVEVTVAPADPAVLTWPAQGSAAVGVGGVDAVASASSAVPLASVTKVVSVMLVLDRMPLQVGEQGPEFSFSWSDSSEYWSYLSDNQSALDVPVGGTLTEHQMLQGILLGSANNYIDRLADEIWGSEDSFVAAAQAWLDSRGLSDITIVTPAGRDAGNVATPEALIRLAEIAMANPVFAEIVGTASVDLPGAGTVKNSNGLLGDPGIVGIKTGTLDGAYNLLSAKDVVIGDTTVHLYAAVLGQKDDDARLAASRALYAEAEAALLAQGPAVEAGTVVGEVSTPWGTRVDVVTDADATVVLWNAGTATTGATFDLGDSTAEGDEVGTLTVTGPIDGVEVPVSLAEELQGPTAWWRLTHPLELFGIVD
ncbi:D-alanyl-D-alanine carboxypeptidase family protein [Microbacterium tumbae]